MKFIFGMRAVEGLQAHADDLPKPQWKRLDRPPEYEIKTEPRERPENVKARIAIEREFDTVVVALKKQLAWTKGQYQLWEEIRYFFYITNDRTAPAEQIVFGANGRCNQENLIEQAKNGVHALRAPVDSLLSNWAYMVMAALAWNLKT